MKRKLKNILFFSLASFVLTIIFASTAYAQGVPADSSGLFDNEILEGIHLLMIGTYKTLGNVLMIGHALMCYAVNVAKTNIFNVLYLPDISLWFVGLGIYTAGIFMSLSVGMYCVDASLRLGIAILFMPISIALWPFPPTSGKFMENLCTIIRNGMLFLLMAVGVSFAVCLVNAGLFEGGDQAFWSAIDMAQTEAISESFSLFNSHILVVGFCLVFGFKLLESSVNNYLNALFSDSMFGSENPMNQMSTQAIGMVSQNVAQPAMSWAKDVATHQTGRLISGAGSMLTHEGRQKVADKFRTAGRIMLNPRQSYNNAMHKIGEKVNTGLTNLGDTASKAILKTGEGVQRAVDAFTAFMPVPASEDVRQDRLYGKLEHGVREQIGIKSKVDTSKSYKDGLKEHKGINNKIGFVTHKLADKAKTKIDKVAPKLGNATEQIISHGGGEIKQGLKEELSPTVSKAVEMASATVATAKEGAKQAIASKIAGGINEVNNMLGRETPAVTAAQVRAGLHAAKVISGDKLDKAKSGASRISDRVMNSQVVQGFKEGLKEGDKAPITLNPSEVISVPFNAIRDKKNLIKSVRKLAGDAGAALREGKGQRTRIIAKASGQIVARTAKGLGKDIKENLKDVGNKADFLGHTIQDFGNWLGNNKHHASKGGKSPSIFKQMQQNSQNAQEQKEKAAELSEYYREANVDDK